MMDLFARFLLKCTKPLYPVKIIGKENLPTDGAILICNHFRAIDCLFVAHVSPKNTYYLAKSELFKNKITGAVLKRLGAIAVNRGSFDLLAIRKSVDVLLKGNKLVIFPEGTRNKTGTDEIQEIKGGTAFISVKAKVPIVPLIIHKKSKLFKKTRIMVGKPFDFSEYYGVKITSSDTEKMESVIREKMLETKRELNAILNRPKKKVK